MRIATTTFLRRTFVLLGAALALATGTPVMAQGKVTLTNTTGNSCDYSEMKVTPNGNIVVTCGTSSGGGNAANFALSHTFANTTVPALTAGNVSVTRAGGPAGEALMVTFSVSGSGCPAGSGANSGGIMLLPNAPSPISFRVGAAGTSCTVQIGAPSGHTASPSSITFTAQAPGGGDPGPVVDGCPAIPTSSVSGGTAVNDFQTVDQRRMASGSVAYYAVPPPRNNTSVIVEFNQTAGNTTPGGVITEVQVSRCPGVMNPPGHSIASQCKQSTSQIQLVSMNVWTAPAAGYNTQSQLPNGHCLAPASDGQYYVNVRWTYQFCDPSFTLGCGFNIRWNERNGNSPF